MSSISDYFSGFFAGATSVASNGDISWGGNGDSSGGDFNADGYDPNNPPGGRGPAIQSNAGKQSYFGAFSAGVDELFSDPKSFFADLVLPSSVPSVSTTAPTPLVENATHAAEKVLPSTTEIKWLIVAVLGITAVVATAYLLHEVKA